MSQFKDIIKEMRFSYSRITSYENCPYAFYLQYILKDFDNYPSEGNYYASNGSAAHETFEAILNNEISVYEAGEKYTELYQKIKEKVKPTIMDNTYNKTLETFMSIEEDWLDGYGIEGVELKLSTTIGDVPFYGFIDLLLRDKKDGRLVLLDHKSAKPFFKKNGGDVYAGLKHQFHEYKTQGYLYSKMIYDHYGEFPKKIVWNHFKDKCKWSEIEFNKDDYYAALNWFDEVYEQICADEDFYPKQFTIDDSVKSDEFYCNNLCNFRKSCEYIRDYNKKHGGWRKR